MNSRHYDQVRLRGLRESKGLTQKQVAESLNINRQTVFRAESGVSASYELLCDLSDLYEADVITLLHPRRPKAEPTQTILAVM